MSGPALAVVGSSPEVGVISEVMLPHGSAYLERMQITFATYNVHHCEGTDGVVDVGRVAKTIRDLRPDVIALQELDQGWERSGGVDQPAELSRLTDLELAFWPTFQKGEKRYGIALGAPEGFHARYAALPGPKGEEPRGVAIAEFDDFTVLVTHLSTRRSTRRQQIKMLAGRVGELLAARPGRPLFLMGDLNHRPLPWGALRRAGLSGGPSTPTYPSDRPRRRIDHILAGPGAQIRAQGAPSSPASDHLPLVAEVVIGP